MQMLDMQICMIFNVNIVFAVVSVAGEIHTMNSFQNQDYCKLQERRSLCLGGLR